MSGFTTQRLVLVQARVAGRPFDIGTGYFVTFRSWSSPRATLVARTTSDEPGSPYRARRPVTRTAQLEPVWRDAALDALLLRSAEPLAEIPPTAWVECDLENNAAWELSAYPDAGKADQDGKPAWKSVGLSGKVYAHGGGQGPKELELTVDAPPENAEQWKGVPARPLRQRELAGLSKEAPRSFSRRALRRCAGSRVAAELRLSPGAVSQVVGPFARRHLGACRDVGKQKCKPRSWPSGSTGR